MGKGSNKKTIIIVSLAISVIVAVGGFFLVKMIMDRNESEKGLENDVVNEEKQPQKTESEDDDEKEPTVKIGEKYVWENSQGGSSIILKDDNTVEETSWATPGGADDYRGTYVIKGKELTITLTQMYDILGEWGPYPDETSSVTTYTIVSESQIKDEEGRVYSTVSNVEDKEDEQGINAPAEEKSESIKVGNSVLKYGKYESEFDIEGIKAFITITDDGTATYVGDMMQDNGNFKDVNLTGTWETKENAITMSQYDENKYSGIYFKWSDGESEAFAIGNDMFGDQWHSFNWISK